MGVTDTDAVFRSASGFCFGLEVVTGRAILIIFENCWSSFFVIMLLLLTVMRFLFLFSSFIMLPPNSAFWPIKPWFVFWIPLSIMLQYSPAPSNTSIGSFIGKLDPR